MQRAAARAGACGGAAYGSTDKDGAADSGTDEGGRQGHRAEDEHYAHAGVRRRRLRRLKEGQVLATKVAWGKKQRPGREAPLLMPAVVPPATHSHVLLHAQAPYGYHRSSSTPELPMALNSPSNPCPWPHPANRYLALHHPRPRVPYPQPHPATHHPCLPAASASCSYPCPGRGRAG